MLALAPLAVAACEAPVPVASNFIPDYKGVETKLLDDDLVQFNVAMTNTLSPKDVENYAECTAARYTLIRGYEFGA